jgi:hypothetical protein
MCQVTQTEEWEPEPLPIGVELGVDTEPPAPRPAHDDAHDSETIARVIVIELV